MLRLVRKICIAQGIDFMCTAQGWAGFNDSTWEKGYAAFTDDKFHLSYGSEMPKYRTGHTWWLGQSSTHGLFDATMDTTYENQYYQSEQGTDWNFESLKFPQVPDIEIVSRFKKSDRSLAIAAHPTSWWMQERGSIEKYVTNVACNLSFGLLSGKIWDGIVAMGYDHDHYFYQNLWFNILNQGYRMPAFSELDGGLGKDDKFYYGSMRTYFQVGGNFTMDKMLQAATKGNSFHTSGPMIIAKIDDSLSYGDIIPADGKSHELTIEVFASGERDDYLSYVVLFRNGQVNKVWDVRAAKPRRFMDTIQLRENEKSWYIIKVYGKRAWNNPDFIDVMKVCEKNMDVERVEGQMDVAFTNPFYFRKGSDTDPAPLQSNIDLTLPGVKNAEIDILMAGESTRVINMKHGRARFAMPVNAVLKIVAKGHPVIYRSLYLDYLPHRALMEELANGKWRKNYRVKYNPGEVPWAAFNFDTTRNLLKNVKWKIEMKQNERDRQYATFPLPR